MYLLKSQYREYQPDDVYIDVDDEPITPINLLRCDKYFTSPISQSQLNYECSAPIAKNTPENNKCKLIDYRQTKVASFCVESKLLICLPQAFELFLKNLVGGLHTVYTKLKRLDIVPIVCNVEQVRILRSLGAIQPGVNRCKLIAPNEFDILYEDCTNSGSRPGRPPKRVHANTESESDSEPQSKKISDSSSCSSDDGKEAYMAMVRSNHLNQLAMAYYNNLLNYQNEMKKNDEENSCKNSIKISDFTVKTNYKEENNNSNASSPTSSNLSSSSRISSSFSNSSSSFSSEIKIKSNPLSIENLIRKDDQTSIQTQKPLNQVLVSSSSCYNSLAFINQQLIQRIDYLTTSVLELESNLHQKKQSLENSLMNERNMRIKYEARIENLVKLRRLLSAKIKRQNMRILKSKIKKK